MLYNTLDARRLSRITKRVMARGEWVAASALHLGGYGPTSSADMALLRDPSGGFYVPGSSIAGALRSALALLHADSYAAFRANKETGAVELLFGKGGGRKDTGGYASRVTILDSHIEASSLFVRDSVRIEAETGLARDGAKFNFEVLPAGVRFPIQMWLHLYHDAPEVDEPALLAAFLQGLRAFQSGLIRLGAKTRRGLGEGAVKTWDVREFDMDNRHHVAAWLGREPRHAGAIAVPEALPAPKTSWFEIKADLRLKTSLLIRSAPHKGGDPDMVHLNENGINLLSGTSFAGAFRHRCARIARTLVDGINLDTPLALLFGPLETQDKRQPLFGGRVWVSECKLAPGARFIQGRVAIDRFTGGAKDTALFEQAPFWPAEASAHVTVKIRIEEPNDWEIGLCLLAFKDLWLGDLSLGGESGAGRGVLLGHRAELEHRTAQGPRRWVLATPDGRPPLEALLEGEPEQLSAWTRAVTGIRTQTDAGWEKKLVKQLEEK